MKLPRIIYAIQHNVTKRIYVGSSANVENRYWNHMNNLRNHKHNIEDMGYARSYGPKPVDNASDTNIYRTVARFNRLVSSVNEIEKF